VTRALLVLALFLVAAAPAHASGTLFGTGAREVVGGPDSAGDRVAWADQRGENVVGLHVAGPDGAARVTRTVGTPDYRFGSLLVDFSASAQRWAFSYFASRCDGKQVCDYSSDSLTAPLGEQPQQALGRRCSMASDPFGSFEVRVSDAAVAYSCNKAVRVRDFGPSPTEDDTEYPGRSFAVAGSFLAVVEEPTALVVHDWRARTERLRFPGARLGLLQPDGKVAFARPGDGAVVWASPESPEPRVVAEGASLYGFAHDRVAVYKDGRLEVRGLDGSVLAAATSPANAHSLSFDGNRFAWWTKPCAQLMIATWDLQGEPPLAPTARCPRAGNRNKVLRANTNEPGSHGFGSIRAKLECPPEPPLGCKGVLDVRLGPGKLRLARGTYDLLPGQTRWAEFGLLKGRICKAGSAALGPVQLTIDGVKRRWVKIGGIREAVSKCR
jgi:hypothetical protein